MINLMPIDETKLLLFLDRLSATYSCSCSLENGYVFKDSASMRRKDINYIYSFSVSTGLIPPVHFPEWACTTSKFIRDWFQAWESLHSVQEAIIRIATPTGLSSAARVSRAIFLSHLCIRIPVGCFWTTFCITSNYTIWDPSFNHLEFVNSMLPLVVSELYFICLINGWNRVVFEESNVMSVLLLLFVLHHQTSKTIWIGVRSFHLVTLAADFTFVVCINVSIRFWRVAI